MPEALRRRDEDGGVVRVQPVLEPGLIRSLCCRRYPNHPKGCPNFGKKLTCPPQCPTLDQVMDLSEPVYAIYNIFPFGEHVARMKARKRKDGRPRTDREARCCLYWQGKARKQLANRTRAFTRQPLPEGHATGPFRVVTCPEACGVNVTATMAAVGIQLEWPPETVAYQIALAGTRPEGGMAENDGWRRRLP